MPELPEVETVRAVLAPRLTAEKITDVQIRNPQILADRTPEEFTACVKGQMITGLSRKGKFLRLQLSGGTITVHLRMTGCLFLKPHAAPLEKHTHVSFLLEDGNELRYEDVRRFGKFWFTKNGESDTSGADNLGIEPFDRALTAQYLQKKCGSSKRAVKQALLDQSIIAGIGNIYSDEILFSAGIRPDRPCNTLSAQEFAKLAAIIPERLEFFIEKNSISFEEYLKSNGKEYRNTPFLQVYGKAGFPCPVCGGTLQRIVLAGRSSVFCPHCQQ